MKMLEMLEKFPTIDLTLYFWHVYELIRSGCLHCQAAFNH